MSRNVCLTGMMGAGKTTVAHLLGDALGRTVVDTDDEVVAHVGKPIPVIFAEAGEAYFRAVEHRVVRQLAAHTDLVVSLGGGVVLSDANVTELLLTGVIVHLDAPVDVLAERLRDEAAGRPLLAGDLDERLRTTLAARAPRYAEAADLTVDATGPPEAVARIILDELLDRGDVLTPSEHEAVMP